MQLSWGSSTHVGLALRIMLLTWCACAWACGDSAPSEALKAPDEPAPTDLPPTTQVGNADDEDDAGTPHHELPADVEDAGKRPPPVLPDEPDPDEPGACGDVPTRGRCLDEHTVERCLSAGNGSEEQVDLLTCTDSELCSEGPSGATCEPVGSCEEGSTRCSDDDTLETCQDDAYEPEACAKGCVASALGAFCAAPVATVELAGSVLFEAVLPNEAFDDWSDSAKELPAAGFLLLSYHGEQLLDAVVTSEDAAPGSFRIAVAESPRDDDQLVLVAAGADSAGTLTHAVARPGYAPSSNYRRVFDDMPDPALWSFSFDVASIEPATPLRVTRAQGSAAAYVFSTVHRVYQFSDGFYAPETPERTLVWMDVGTQWDCGACMASYPARAFDTRFQHQLWLDGSDSEGYWATPVTAHELGHYVMCAFGAPPGEAGSHYIGLATNPGLAWSEGFATFFGSLARDSSLYYSKQGGVFFWFDLEQRSYDDGYFPWVRAAADAGLEQLIDENEVAAMLWATYQTLADFTPVLDALASPRMTTAPFARGYIERSWDDPLHPEDYEETGDSHPHLADFFDALRCADAISAEQLDDITEPDTLYPYPSESPLCD
jgi:hypothetical protein